MARWLSVADPTFDRQGSRFLWTFPPHLTITLDRWKEGKDGLSAECTVRLGTGVLTQGRLNLSSKVTRLAWIKDLTHQHDHAEWRLILETVCLQGLKEYRQGEPILLLEPPTALLSLPWRIRPLVHDRLPTVLYGPGGIGKSYVALWTALAVEAGLSQSGFAAAQARALYLDWEMEADYMVDRTERLRRGCAALSAARPFYRRCEAPLSDMQTELAQWVAEHEIGYLVVDSLGPACGGDLASPDTAIRFFRALRSLRVSACVLAHVAKNAETKSIYGSVFFSNLARSVWEVEGVTPYLTLTHRKSNLSARQPAFALELIFSDESVSLCEATLEVAQTAQPLSHAEEQLKHALLEGPKDSHELEAATQLKRGTVTGTLTRGKGIWCALTKQGRWYLLPE